MICSPNILDTENPMPVKEVRKKLAPHLGARVRVRGYYSGGYAYSLMTGTLGRYGNHIGISSRNGLRPDELDTQIAGMYELLDNPAGSRNPYVNGFGKLLAPFVGFLGVAAGSRKRYAHGPVSRYTVSLA